VKNDAQRHAWLSLMKGFAEQDNVDQRNVEKIEKTVQAIFEYIHGSERRKALKNYVVLCVPPVLYYLNSIITVL
jgi:hypothetical protein